MTALQVKKVPGFWRMEIINLQ